MTTKTFSVTWRVIHPAGADLVGRTRVHATDPRAACLNLLETVRETEHLQQLLLAGGRVRVEGVEDHHGIRRDFPGMGDM